MPRLKPLTLLLGLYIPILLAGLLLPRSASNDYKPMSMIEKIFYDILYLTGPPEIFLNFLLFIPFFLALLLLNPALSRYSAALISCLTSAAAELAQSQIPGRVSSMRDFLSNCVGVVVTLAFITGFPKGKSPKSF
jgi:glycopeptide antibiotics resistance protein